MEYIVFSRKKTSVVQARVDSDCMYPRLPGNLSGGELPLSFFFFFFFFLGGGGGVRAPLGECFSYQI